MADEVEVTPAPAATVISYPLFPEHVAHDYNASLNATGAATKSLRQCMKNLLVAADKKKCDIAGLKDHFKKYFFNTDKERDEFFKIIESLEKLGDTITSWTTITEAELREYFKVNETFLPNTVQSFLKENLTEDDPLQADIVSLSLHILTSANILFPIGKPVIAYGMRLDKEIIQRITALISEMVKHSGKESLVPLITYLEWETQLITEKAKSVPGLQKKINEQENKIQTLETDINLFKEQTQSTSPYTWEI